MKADLDLIDKNRLRLLPPRMEQDLPANGSRLLQRAEGLRVDAGQRRAGHAKRRADRDAAGHAVARIAVG
ncbi:MAG: hypothetical protein U5K56_04430 [Halioglobus sp.]|nr:hypothetical protein [Halioglobus sp.]